MSTQIIRKSTLELIRHLHYQLDKDFEWYNRIYYQTNFNDLSINAIRNELLYLNEQLKNNHEIEYRSSNLTKEAYPDWLYYDAEQEIIPIYNEAISIVKENLIINPSDIMNLLYFMNIGNKSGVDIENHDSKGYHFHYGKVKKGVLNRYNVLLTFNKNDKDSNNQPIENIPLYIEPHASGKCSHIDASTISHKRRYPIYLVCTKAMESRGLENFLNPSNDSNQFFPM